LDEIASLSDQLDHTKIALSQEKIYDGRYNWAKSSGAVDDDDDQRQLQ